MIEANRNNNYYSNHKQDNQADHQNYRHVENQHHPISSIQVDKNTIEGIRVVHVNTIAEEETYAKQMNEQVGVRLAPKLNIRSQEELLNYGQIELNYKPSSTKKTILIAILILCISVGIFMFAWYYKYHLLKKQPAKQNMVAQHIVHVSNHLNGL